MDSLVRASLFVRRAFRGGYGFALTCLLAGWVVAGGATAPLGVVPIAGTVVWAFLLVKRLRSKLRLTGDAPFLLDFELGALLAVGLDAALLRFDGTLSGRFSPATYVLVALVASFGRPIAGLAVVGWVVALDALIRFRTLGQASLEALATQAGFASAFALLNLLLTAISGKPSWATEPEVWFNYGCFMLFPIFGLGLQKYESPFGPALGRSFVAALAFFVLSNIPVYFVAYPRTLAGLVDCYYMALPFFPATIGSAVFFTGVLFSPVGVKLATQPAVK